MQDTTVLADLLIEHLHDGVIGIDCEHRITMMNQYAEDLFGFNRERLLGQPLDVLLPESTPVDHRDDVGAFLSQPVRARAMGYGRAVEAVDNDGKTLFLEGTIVRTTDFSDETVAVAVFRDVTQQQWTRNTLRQASRIFSSAREGIMVTDASTRIVSVNQAFSDITGYTEEEVLGRTPAILQSGRQDAAFYEKVWRSVRGTGQWQGEIWNRRKSGEIYPEWLTISAVPDQHGRVINYVGVFTDISRVRAAENRVEELTHFDPLTSLGNWHWLRSHLEHALERAHSTATSGALLFVNLDRFSMINESLGLTAGDLVLQQIAGRLRIGLDESVTIARTRGDEFAVLSEDLSLTGDPGTLAERIKSIIQEKIDLIAGREVRITAKIGISLFPTDGNDAHTILQTADTALHRVGEEGSREGYCFYDAAQTAKARARINLERQLYRGIEKKEFVAWYQPVIRIGDGRIVGAEALVRWLHPERGMLVPAEFIEIAEATGLTESIGNQVLECACRHAAAWHADGFPELSIAVNLSAHQFQSEDLLTRVGRLLAETGLPARRLTLEITETTLMAHASRVTLTLNGLHRMGVRLAIDDFGTGYSSLAYLQRFHADILKVDRSFVQALPGDGDSARIISAILALAHGLDMDVIVEGVETESQRKSLEQLGVERVQGFLASPPVSAETFAGLLGNPGWILNRART